MMNYDKLLEGMPEVIKKAQKSKIGLIEAREWLSSMLEVKSSSQKVESALDKEMLNKIHECLLKFIVHSAKTPAIYHEIKNLLYTHLSTFLDAGLNHPSVTIYHTKLIQTIART